MKVTILGCGASAGVPLIGCRCAVCLSPNPKNRRSRVSVLLEDGGSRVMVDASPDLREQCLRHDITWVDAIIVTHCHTDHVSGLDDARAFNYSRNTSLPVYASRKTLNDLFYRFEYAFQPMKEGAGWYKPHYYPKEVTDNSGEFAIGYLNFKPFRQGHGEINTMGLRTGGFAYSPDTNELDEQAFSVLAGTKVWLVDCLRLKPAPTHAHLDLTLEWIRKVKPELAILTHMNHEMEYDEIMGRLPQGVVMAYDGMVINI